MKTGKKNCPKCNSGSIKIIDYLGIKCIVCRNCGYDESGQYDAYAEEKISQKAKGRHTPYKAGGFGRIKK